MNNPMKSALGRRLFTTTALLVVLAVGFAVAVTLLIGNRIAGQAVPQMLERANRVQATFEEQRLDQLHLLGRLLASDPNYAAYMAEAIASGNSLSALDQLDERQRELGYDFAIVLDAQGQVFARTDAVRSATQDLSTEPLVKKAREEFEAYGVWGKDGQLFDATAVPIQVGGLLEGFLITGYAIDAQTAIELRSISATEVTVLALAPDLTMAAVASTLEGGLLAELTESLSRRPELLRPASEGSPQHQELTLGGRRFLALTRPLLGAQGEMVGMVVSLASLAEHLAPYRQIGQALAGVGLLAVLGALVLSFWLARHLLAPVSQLVTAAAAAAEGDYDQRLETTAQDEIGQLARAFATLLAELREKRDMEVYINELSRNLPEPAEPEVKPTVVPASEREVCLLGVELRDYAPQELDPERALDHLSRELRPVSNAVAAQKGRVEALLGHRLVASFDGRHRAEKAMAAAADILVRASSGTATPKIVAALSCGAVVSGSLLWGEDVPAALSGAAVTELESLLRVAQPGNLLLAQSVYEILQPALVAARVEPQAHRSSVSRSTLYSLNPFQASSLSSLEVSATQHLTQAPLGHAPTLSQIGPGSVLGNRFEILSVLGSGGMGIVYKARDRTLDELVALKMLKHQMFDGGEQLERLKDELRLARKIGHPNVLRTFDFGEMDGIPFITMEYVLGITLRQLLDQSGRLPLSAGLRLARQLCRGLAVAHEQSVLHRDIKPENLIIEHTGNAKLMDFGIARTIVRGQPGQTRPGSVVGTPFYLAPEQLAGQEPDERADLYACGVVFYEIFTGQLPFSRAGNILQIITQKLNEVPQPPRQHWPSMPEPLERIILRCLERDREARFASVSELLQELEVLRAGVRVGR